MSHSSRVFAAAIAYARVGVPVAPAHPIRRRLLPQLSDRIEAVCGCRDPRCAIPGAHARDAPDLVPPTTDLATVRALWDTAEAPNLMIRTGGLIEGCEVTAGLSELAARQLHAELSGAPLRALDEPGWAEQGEPWPPMARAADGRRLFLTAPHAEIPPTIDVGAERVRWFEAGELVAVPPSRRSDWPATWEWSPNFPDATLPDPDALVNALRTAADQLRHPERYAVPHPAGEAAAPRRRLLSEVEVRRPRREPR